MTDEGHVGAARVQSRFAAFLRSPSCILQILLRPLFVDSSLAARSDFCDILVWQRDLWRKR